MFSDFVSPLGTEKVGLLRKKPPYHSDFIKSVWWFTKFSRPWQSAPEISTTLTSMPEPVGRTYYKRSLHIYSGGIVQSLKDSTRQSSVLLNACGRHLRAYEVEWDRIESHEPPGFTEIPRLKKTSKASFEAKFSETHCCQICVQTCGEQDLVGLRFPHSLQFWTVDHDDGAEDSAGTQLEACWKVSMPSVLTKDTVYSDVDFYRTRPNKGLVAASNGEIYRFDLDNETFETVAVTGSDMDWTPFEHWHGVRTLAHPHLLYAANRVSFRVVDTRLVAKQKPIFEYCIAKEDSKLCEEIYNIHPVATPDDDGEIVVVVTDKEVRAFDRRRLGRVPVWRRLHYLSSGGPLYSVFLPDEGLSSDEGRDAAESPGSDFMCGKRYFPRGSLFLAGHCPNHVSQYDVGDELEPWRQEAEFPRAQLAGIMATSFRTYRALRSPDEVAQRLVECGESVSRNLWSKFELPLTGLTHHVIKSRSRKNQRPSAGPVLFTCNAAGDIFCSFRRFPEEEEQFDVEELKLQREVFRNYRNQEDKLFSESTVDKGVIVDEDFDLINLDKSKQTSKWVSQNKGILAERAKGNEDFTAELVANKARVAFRGSGGGGADSPDTARMPDHLCALDDCKGKPDDAPGEFTFRDDEPLRREPLEAAFRSAEYVFLPGFRTSLHLVDPRRRVGSEDPADTEDLWYDEGKELFEKMKVYVEPIPTTSPYLPGRNVALRLRNDFLLESEIAFLESSPGQPTQWPPIDELAAAFDAAMRRDAELRAKEAEEAEEADAYDPEVASFLNATKNLGGEKRGEGDDDDEEEEEEEEEGGGMTAVEILRTNSCAPRTWASRKGPHRIPRVTPAPARIVKRMVSMYKHGRQTTGSVLALEATMLKEVMKSKLELSEKQQSTMVQRSSRRALLATYLGATDSARAPNALLDPQGIDPAMALQDLSTSNVPLFFGGPRIKPNPEVAARMAAGNRLEEEEEVEEPEPQPPDLNFCETISTMSTVKTGQVDDGGDGGFTAHELLKMN